MFMGPRSGHVGLNFDCVGAILGQGEAMLRHLQPMLGLRSVILGLYVCHVAQSWGWHAMSNPITSSYKFRVIRYKLQLDRMPPQL